MQILVDIGLLPIIGVLLFAAVAKFHLARSKRSWLAFADGMARLGLAAFYLMTYLMTLHGGTALSDQARSLDRIGILAMFMIEAVPWLIGLFIRNKKP